MVELYPIHFEKEAFLKIPEPEREFFVQLGWLCNDLMLFHRLMVATNHNDVSQEHLQRGNSSIILSVFRLFTSRLAGGWEMLSRSYFGNRVSIDYDPILAQEGKESLRVLKEYFSKANPILTLRNNYGSHSDPECVRDSMNNLYDNAQLTLYLSDKYGNSLYWFADEIVANGMLNSLSTSNHREALDQLYDDCLRISAAFFNFAGHSMYSFVERHTDLTMEGLKKKAIILNDLPSLEDIRLPFFVQEG